MIDSLIIHAIALSANSGISVSGISSNSSQLFGLLVFLAIIITLRLYRGLNGRIYSTARVLRTPIIYILITLFTIFLSGILNATLESTLLLIPLGTLLGYAYGTKVSFFYRNNFLYYKRSPIIMIIWLVSLIIRFVLEILIPLNQTGLLIIDLLLAGTTGILMGEALNIIKKKKEFKGPETPEAATQF
ncbi:MAG: hypothetical protein AAE983_05980 [Thermoplasmataceae archaeon]|jgi:hypothetical protein